MLKSLRRLLFLALFVVGMTLLFETEYDRRAALARETARERLLDQIPDEAVPSLPIADAITPPLSQVVVDRQTGARYATTATQFGRIDADGAFVPIAPDPRLPALTRTHALAFDSTARRIVLTGPDVAYTWQPDTDTWAFLPAFADLDVTTLAFDPGSDTFVAALGESGWSLRHLVRVDRDGTLIESIALDHPIPTGDTAQLHVRGDALLLQVPARTNLPAHVYRIAAATGTVHRLVANGDA